MDQVLPMTHIVEHARSPRPKRISPPARTRVVCQLWRAAEKQVEQVEARLEALGDEPQSLEREAKTLGIIARTVRDLIAIDEEKTKAKCGAKSDGEDTLGTARALIDFRRELAAKLDQLRAERSGNGTAGNALAEGD